MVFSSLKLWRPIQMTRKPYPRLVCTFPTMMLILFLGLNNHCKCG